ncbi:DUF4158 domain-containing protein [Paraburkholderia acidicola]|uniref:DUF4158 domain-containing protein n=1 Tax=Paraburkholderia acidicola TaxID=1912599 RepID=UPI001A96F517|nr:DUF4158 domain-containing protein [Paraburkholderia acidicola]
MASIERTAYPLLKRNPSARELAEVYTPTDSELTLATRQVREPTRRLSFLLLPKGFQRLGYFPVVDEVPVAIMRHVRDALRFSGHTRPAMRKQLAIPSRVALKVLGASYPLKNRWISEHY